MQSFGTGSGTNLWRQTRSGSLIISLPDPDPGKNGSGSRIQTFCHEIFSCILYFYVYMFVKNDLEYFLHTFVPRIRILDPWTETGSRSTEIWNRILIQINRNLKTGFESKQNTGSGSATLEICIGRFAPDEISLYDKSRRSNLVAEPARFSTAPAPGI